MKTGFTILAFICSVNAFSQAVIIDHASTTVTAIPETYILEAKKNLHIAYGHTSHGSQLTDGMTGLVSFMNGKGYTQNLYTWNNGGSGGALDLHDYAMGGDVGYYPDWVNNTRKYLGNPNAATGRGTGTNADVNVIIWSWCGQVSGKYSSGKLKSEYIDPMVQLEKDYPAIRFVYMTGHLDHSNDAANKAANQTIRDFCVQNNKVLYDFADIESYDPDNKYFQYASDDCSYYSSAGKLLGNWAVEWQNSHRQNVDWYSCGAAHSQPLNANRKAYAVWWMWARLAGWTPSASLVDDNKEEASVSLFPNPSDGNFRCISTKSDITGIALFDITGRKLFSVKSPVPVKQQAIDVRGVTKGTYSIRIETTGIAHTEKVVIQ